MLFQLSLHLYLLSQTLHLQTNECCLGDVLDFQPHFNPLFQEFDETFNRTRIPLAEWRVGTLRQWAYVTDRLSSVIIWSVYEETNFLVV